MPRHVASLLRTLRQHSEEKTGYAIGQARPDVLRQPQRRFYRQLELELRRFVFIDEIWTATNTMGSHGPCAKGERFRIATFMAIVRQLRWSRACA